MACPRSCQNCHLIYCTLLLASMFLSIPSRGQAPAQGIPPFATLQNGPDQITLSDLSTHYVIPVFSRAGRGRTFSFQIDLDSVVWSQSISTGVLTWTPFFHLTGGAFSGVGAVFYSTGTKGCRQSDGEQTSMNTWTFDSFQDANGATHPLGVRVNDQAVTDGTCTATPASSGTSRDGSGISISATNAPSATITLA